MEPGRRAPSASVVGVDPVRSILAREPLSLARPLPLRALSPVSILAGTLARGRLAEALTISLSLAARCTRSALQTLWAALRTLSAARLSLSARLTLPVPLLTLIWRPRASLLPGAAGLPLRLASACRVRRPPILPPRIAGAALAGAALAGAALEAIVTETGASRFEAGAEPPRARADRLGPAIEPEVALPAQAFEPALAPQFRTFDDSAEDAAQDRTGRDLARVRFASVLGGCNARGGQEGRDGDGRDPKMLQERLPKSACRLGTPHPDGSSLHVS